MFIKSVGNLLKTFLHLESNLGEDKEHQLFLYWNPNQLLPAGANATISQALHCFGMLDTISTHIAVQLDNCAVNKNYTVFGGFGLLLYWVPEIEKVNTIAN